MRGVAEPTMGSTWRWRQCLCLHLVEKEIVYIVHYEAAFYCNEGKKWFWMENGKKKLLPKAKGSSIMVSGFVCQCHGFMRATVDGNELKSYKLFYAGTSREGWFGGKDVVQQLKECAPLFHHLHPNCIIRPAFDCSMTHLSKAPDGLDVTNLLRSNGGKNTPVLRKTKFTNAVGDVVEQCMQTEDGTQKGTLAILQERGVLNDKGAWKIGLNAGHAMCHHCSACKINPVAAGEHHYGKDETCCAKHYLAQQPDFMAQKPWLEETCLTLHLQILIFPKYHCELNFIEMIWGWLKSHHRRTCTYNFKDLERELPNTIEQLLPISVVRRYARYCFRFMSGYRLGLTGTLLDFSVKQYKSHRRIPEGVVAALTNMYDEKQAVKLEKCTGKKRSLPKFSTVAAPALSAADATGLQ